MKAKALTTGLVAIAIVALLATVAVGPVAGKTVALPQNETFDVSNDTEALRAVAENATGELVVDVNEVNATTGNETLVATGTLNATDAAGGTDTYRFEAIDAANVSQYKISVHSPPNSTVALESLALEKVVVVSGGGLLSSGSSSSPIIAIGAIVAIGGLVALSRRD